MHDAQGLDFFISYTDGDVDWAEWVAMVLEQAGYSVVVRTLDFSSGSFIVDMEDAVRRADYLLPMISPRYASSKYGLLEWAAYAHDDPAKIIPVQVEEASGRSLLQSFNRIRLFGRSEADCRDELLTRLRDLVREPGPAGTPRRIAAFPGPTGSVPDPQVDRDRPTLADVPPIQPDHDALQLVVLGSGEARKTSVAALPGLLGVPDRQTLDLYDSTLSAEQQLAAIRGMLDERELNVSDVVIVVAGNGRSSNASGWQIDIGDLGPPLRLPLILDTLGFHNTRRARLHLILDVTDQLGGHVTDVDGTTFPVLTLHGHSEGSGVSRLVSTLTQRDPYATQPLGHGYRLTLQDLNDLKVGSLTTDSGIVRAHDIALFDNPGAWPPADERRSRGRGSTDVALLRSPRAMRRSESDDAGWCFVQSTTDRRAASPPVGQIVSNLEQYGRRKVQDELRRASDPGITLAPQMARCYADVVLASPAAFAAAVREVCQARVAVFDLTGYEPAVMLLLGIRAVVRRGVTLCIRGPHDALHPDGAVPFQVQEVSIVATDPTEPADHRSDQVRDRLLTGISQLQNADYADLPAFMLVRATMSPEASRSRPFDDAVNPTMLALVPFNAGYSAANWRRLQERLPDAARTRTETDVRPALLRTLDMGSPRIVSPRLYEALRTIDFCLVDLTHARPSVLFELGVRLTVNSLHPVVIVDDAQKKDESEPSETDRQRDQLAALLQAVHYRSDTEDRMPDPYDQMVARHLRLRDAADADAGAAVLAGFPPRGVYDLAWSEAVPAEEPVATPVDVHLRAEAEAMLVDASAGARKLVYPPEHDLARIADRQGRERLVAAWLYQTHRLRIPDGPDRGRLHEYGALCDRLLLLLDGDDDAEFARQVEAIRRGLDDTGFDNYGFPSDSDGSDQ